MSDEFSNGACARPVTGCPAPTRRTRSPRGAGLLAAAAPQVRRRASRRGVVVALAAALLVAGAFGVGYAVAAGGARTVTKTRVVDVKARLDAGPGFLPADGWSTGVTLDPHSGSILAATATSANGTRIAARFAPASTRRGLQARTLPLQLPTGGRTRSLTGHRR